MKVMIATLKVPPFVGGAENMAYQLARSMRSYCDVSILTTGKDATYQKDDINVTSIPDRRPYSLHYELLKKRLYGLIESEKIDVLNIHGSLPFGFNLRDAPAKKVITCHGMERLDSNFVKNYLRKNLIGAALRSSDIVVSPGDSFSKLLKNEYNVDPCVIPNGIDLEKFMDYGLRRERKKILFVGRFIRLKGIDIILKVAEKMPDHEFLFAGKGPMGPQINLPNTRVIGPLSHTDLILLYNQCDICIFPTRAENHPLVCLEAMACGCIVIAAPPGFDEIIDDGYDGYIIEDYDPDRFIRTIRSIRDIDRIRVNAKKKAKNYSWKNISKKYYGLFSDLMSP